MFLDFLRWNQTRIFDSVYGAIENSLISPQKDWGSIVAEMAMNYLNQKERPGNKGWFDAKFEKSMRAIGFRTGHAWCCYFSERVWTDTAKVYNENMLIGIKKLFSGSTQKTFVNFKKYGPKYGYEVDSKPQIGDVIIWQRKNKRSLGHAGICVGFYDNGDMKTIEGNTNGSGSREGDGVYTKRRRLTGTSSMIIRGYIRPIK